MTDKSLHDHLTKARAARNPDKLREHAARIAKLPRRIPPAECNCGRTDGTHKATCPVYYREYRAQREEKKGR